MLLSGAAHRAVGGGLRLLGLAAEARMSLAVALMYAVAPEAPAAATCAQHPMRLRHPLPPTPHPQVFLTSTHLGIAMEYASGGELFDRIVRANRFSEDEARYFFQQLISGVAWCHKEVRRPAAAGCRLWGGATRSQL